MSRLSIDDYALVLAYAASLRSEDPHCQVGAAAFDHENRVIGLGYNGLSSGYALDAEQWADREGRLPFILHAETNLLSLFKRGEARLVATTILPCGACARQIVAHKVKKVIFCEPYERDTSAVKIFNTYGVQLEQLPPPVTRLKELSERLYGYMSAAR